MGLGVAVVLLLSACAGQSEQTASTNSTKNITAKTKAVIVNGLKIKVEKQEVDPKIEENKKQSLYTFSIKVDNVSATNKGIGAIDFVLKLKSGKEIKIDSSMFAFGDELKVGKSIQGKAFFTVNSKQIPSKLVYQPVKKDLAEWDVNAK